MRNLILILFAILSLSSLGHAQSDSNYKAAIEKLFLVTNTQQTYETVIKQMFGMFKQNQSEVPSDIWTEMEKEMLKSSMPELVDLLIPVYNKHLSLEDIEGVIKFYESPLGKKFADKSPLITQESMQVGQKWGEKLAMNVMKRLEEQGY